MLLVFAAKSWTLRTAVLIAHDLFHAMGVTFADGGSKGLNPMDPLALYICMMGSLQAQFESAILSIKIKRVSANCELTSS